jgi:hypothetical protein
MEKRLAYAYGRTLALSRLGWLLVAFALVIAFLSIAGSLPLLPMALFLAALAVATLLFAISPLLTQHWLTRSRLILRQGWYFHVALTMSEIISLAAADETSPLRVPLGIHRPLGQPTLYVTGGRTGLVIVRLGRPRRFWSSFGLEATQIVFDVSDRDGFLRAYEERRSLLAPVQADRADADLRD